MITRLDELWKLFDNLRDLGAAAGALFTVLAYPFGVVYEWATGANAMTEEGAGAFRDTAATFLSVVAALTAGEITFYSTRMKQASAQSRQVKEGLRSLQSAAYAAALSR